MADNDSLVQAQETMAKMASLVNAASEDPALMARLVSNWRLVLKEQEIIVPSDVELVFLQNRKNLWFIPVAHKES